MPRPRQPADFSSRPVRKEWGPLALAILTTLGMLIYCATYTSSVWSDLNGSGRAIVAVAALIGLSASLFAVRSVQLRNWGWASGAAVIAFMTPMLMPIPRTMTLLLAGWSLYLFLRDRRSNGPAGQL